jgi:DNA mismatch repair protein MutS2
METLLQDLHADRKAAADLRYELSMERAEAEHLRRELEREKAAQQERRAEILNAARGQARQELEELQVELARIRAESRRRGVSQEQLVDLRGQARALEPRTAREPSTRPALRRGAEPPAEVLAGPLEVGDTVRVVTMNTRGELLTLPDARGEVEVQLGALKLRVQARDLERLSKRQARGVERGIVTLPPAHEGEPPPLQLDLRGQRVDDVLPEVDKYLNDAYLTGMQLVRLLHGKGTGALRQAIRDQLAHHPLVKSFEAAAQKDGGEGVTVVALQQR